MEAFSRASLFCCRIVQLLWFAKRSGGVLPSRRRRDESLPYIQEHRPAKPSSALITTVTLTSMRTRPQYQQLPTQQLCACGRDVPRKSCHQSNTPLWPRPATRSALIVVSREPKRWQMRGLGRHAVRAAGRHQSIKSITVAATEDKVTKNLVFYLSSIVSRYF